jgi:tripartite-type tricarboxylate transporter receptor subunit TctC
MGIGSVGTHAHNQTLYKKPPYDAVTDFIPIALIAETPSTLVARKDLPVSNLQEFVAYTRANQAKMQFGSPGAGASSHIACVHFGRTRRLPFSHLCTA